MPTRSSDVPDDVCTPSHDVALLIRMVGHRGIPMMTRPSVNLDDPYIEGWSSFDAGSAAVVDAVLDGVQTTRWQATRQTTRWKATRHEER